MKKEIQLFIPYIKRKLLGKKFVASIIITNSCNLRCKHCYYLDELVENENVPIGVWEKRFLDYYKKGIRLAYLTGGEPSLRLDVLEKAQEIFPAIAVFTNGQIKIADNFKHRIFLSLDGTEKMHDSARGKGTFRRAWKNYLNDKRVLVNCVLSKFNYQGKNELFKFINLIKKMNVQGLHIEFYIPSKGEGYKNSLSPTEKNEIGEILLTELDKKDNIIFTTKNVVKKQISGELIKSQCDIKCESLIFDSWGRRKEKVAENNNCDLCEVRERYQASIWNLIDKYKISKVRKNWTLKI